MNYWNFLKWGGTIVILAIVATAFISGGNKQSTTGLQKGPANQGTPGTHVNRPKFNTN